MDKILSNCCGAQMVNGGVQCEACGSDGELDTCDVCEGTGEVEEQEYECNDSTGYNNVAMGTGKMLPCPEGCKKHD